MFVRDGDGLGAAVDVEFAEDALDVRMAILLGRLAFRRLCRRSRVENGDPGAGMRPRGLPRMFVD